MIQQRGSIMSKLAFAGLGVLLLMSGPRIAMADVPSACGVEATVCPGTVWVGIRTTPSDCTEGVPSGWIADKLFGADAHPPLDKYCVFEWIGSVDPPATSDVNTLKNGLTNLISDLEQDCLAVGPSATFNEYRDWRADVSRREGGSLTTPAARSDTYIRLAFLDTAPDRVDPTSMSDTPYEDAFLYTAPTSSVPPDALNLTYCDGKPCSPHGHSLVGMSRNLLCPSSSGCGSIHFSTRNALPRLNLAGKFTRKRPRGGLSGYISDIASAIDAEVMTFEDDKKTLPASFESKHLVLNLSLGWEPCFGSEVDESHGAVARTSVVAVYDALRHATCHGALVIAGAGNFQGAPNYGGTGTPAGATLPGGWEVLPSDTTGFTDCESLTTDTPQYTPLLYAVGGVDAEDRPIANTRPLARPRLVAFSDHASSGIGEALLTGTSVGTAIVSSTASAVWATSPAMKPAEVMAAVWDGGEVLSPPLGAQFWCGTPPSGGGATVPGCGSAPVTPLAKATHRIFVVGHASGMPVQANGDDIPPGNGNWKKAEKRAVPSKPGPGLGAAGWRTAQPGCQGEIPWAPAGQLPARCVYWKKPTLSATPWGGPQPDNNPCPTCTYKGSLGPVFITLDPDFTIEGDHPGTPTEVALVVGPDVTNTDWDPATSPSRRYSVTVPLDFNITSNTAIVCIDAGPTDSMLLSMKVNVRGEVRAVVAPVLKSHWGTAPGNPCS